MKKIKLKYIIFSILAVSATVSVATSIPYALVVQTENFNSQLKIFTKDASSAKSLASITQFDSAEFDKLVANLKPKEKFAKRLNAYDALNLHFDSVYNFDLNDAVDFSELSKKYPDLLFKLVLPESKSAIEIKQNVLKNLGINVSNAAKSINYTTKFDLDFSKQEKSFQFSPENFSASISLSKLKFLEGKTATETAILFYNSFRKNFNETNDATKALYKTFSEFGGISFSLNSEPIFALPSNFEIKPQLEVEKLVFSKVSDEKNELVLNMVLFNKLTQKETKFLLKFVDLPKANQKYGAKFLEIFKKNYQFSNEISKHLAKNNSTVYELFSKNSELNGLNLSEFDTWFKTKQTTITSFLDEIKHLVADFSPTKTSFTVKKPEKSVENKNLVTIELKIDGNLKNQELPLGLKLGENNQYSYTFEFNFDATESIYSGYFKNAIENFDAKTAENLDDLKFEVKKNLPVTIFASTIDDKIKHLLNRPLNPKNITKEIAPLFTFFNYFADKNETEQTEENDKQNSSKSPESPEKSVPVSTTLFQDKSPVINLISKPSSTENAGDYLRKLFENLEKANFPKNTTVFLSTSYKDKYTLEIEIKTGELKEEKLKIKIDKVSKNNEAYEALAKSANVHLFLDWRTNVETKVDENNKKPVLSSISAVNDANLKFEVDSSYETKSNEVPVLDAENQGIYLAEKGIVLEKPKDSKVAKNLKLNKDTTLFYAFKPTKLPRNLQTRYFLLRSRSTKNKEFSLIIEPDNLNQKYNRIGVDFIDYDKTSTLSQDKIELKWWKKEGTQLTYNGDLKLQKEQKPDKSETVDISKKSKSIIDENYDFLNDPDSTIILVVNVKEGEENKPFLEIAFYSSKGKNPLEPKFKWNWELSEKDIEIDLSKDLNLGTIKSKEQLLVDKVYKVLHNMDRNITGITFKAFALFDKSKNDSDYNNILEKFIQEYIG
ncbi:P110/LppT family adhesin N-terminal domain [Mesomycoplasma dispar]|uniref:Uncharacterized protein n=1 Tax=Mesomycoplasma dispar TaxID=86660 RepID=A0ABM6PR42_9BACT|nr:P110/LppT family adhesin N-terminal domain [Mesomycoplasma dispar]ATP59633.1 hypothetical protein CSW10_01585 [Mesomycoplasma dispar]